MTSPQAATEISRSPGWSHLAVPAAVGAALASIALAGALWGSAAAGVLTLVWLGAGLAVSLRWFDAACAGVLTWWCVCLTVAWRSLHHLANRSGTRTLVEQRIVAALALTAAAAAVVVVAWLVAGHRRGVGVRCLAERMWRGAFERPQQWTTWIVGGGATLSLVLISSPWSPHNDSIWLVLSSHVTWEEGLGLIRRTQDVFVPTAIFWPIVKVGGYRLANLVICGLTVAFVALVGVLGRRLAGGRPVGAFAAVAVAMATSVVMGMPLQLPLYPLMLGLGYLGGWLLHHAMSEPDAPRYVPAVAAASLVLATESHAAGQLFLAVPVLMLALHPWARARRPLLISLGTMAVLMIPRVLVNLSVGGLSGFRSNRTDFMVQNGYLDLVNRRGRSTVAGGPPHEYLSALPDMVRGAFGPRLLWPILGLLLFAFIVAKARTKVFALVVVGFFLLALAIAAPTPAPRYLLPLVGLAGPVVASGMAWLVRRGGAVRILASAIVLITFVIGLDQAHTATHRWLRRHRPTPGVVDLARIVGDDVVMGIRSMHLLREDPEVRAESSRTLPEKDFVTYLTWPSTEAVREVLDRWDVRYLLLVKDREAEVEYHELWIKPTYGLEVQHATRIARDPGFCLVAETEDYLLYEASACS